MPCGVQSQAGLEPAITSTYFNLTPHAGHDAPVAQFVEQ